MSIAQSVDRVTFIAYVLFNFVAWGWAYVGGRFFWPDGYLSGVDFATGMAAISFVFSFPGFFWEWKKEESSLFYLLSGGVGGAILVVLFGIIGWIRIPAALGIDVNAIFPYAAAIVVGGVSVFLAYLGSRS